MTSISEIGDNRFVSRGDNGELLEEMPMLCTGHLKKIITLTKKIERDKTCLV